LFAMVWARSLMGRQNMPRDSAITVWTVIPVK
jgi:hypothetical protein